MKQLPPDESIEANAALHRTKKIGVVVFDGFALLPVGAVVETLHLANVIHAGASRGETPYDVRLISAYGGVVRSASSIGVHTAQVETLQQPFDFHAVFAVTGRHTGDAKANDPSSDTLRRFIGCAGMIFAIANDHSHADASGPEWLREHVARTMGENAQIGKVGLAASPVELVLALVEYDLGSEIARNTARHASQPLRWHFCSLVGKRSVAALSQQIQRAAHWIETNAQRSITIDGAAKFASMSSRNLQRRFKEETSITPSEYLQQVRIELCCKMLAETRLPVDKIERRCGLASGAQLSKLLRRCLDTTPTDYRAQMQASLSTETR